MRNALFGFLIGVAATTVGFSGMSVILDAVGNLQNVIQQNAK
jgi:hypothetical protein